MADDEVLEFNFGGVEPAVAGVYVSLPKGEYNLQCLRARKYLKGDKGGSEAGDASKPGLEFTFVITNHPTFEGTEVQLWHPIAKSSEAYLLNTLMCLIPEKPWQQDGIKVPLSILLQQVQGRPCNGTIIWKVNTYEGKKRVQNKLQGLKAYDASITPPVASEGNPPIIINDETSETKQAASAGVPANEVADFLSNFPGGTATPAAPASDFGLEPF